MYARTLTRVGEYDRALAVRRRIVRCPDKTKKGGQGGEEGEKVSHKFDRAHVCECVCA